MPSIRVQWTLKEYGMDHVIRREVMKRDKKRSQRRPENLGNRDRVECNEDRDLMAGKGRGLRTFRDTRLGKARVRARNPIYLLLLSPIFINSKYCMFVIYLAMASSNINICMLSDPKTRSKILCIQFCTSCVIYVIVYIYK